MSSSRTRFIHYGGAFNREEKTTAVAESSVALRHLHVCWRSWSDENCNNCEKCYRTMVVLDLCGKLAQASTFDRERFDVNRLSRIYISNHGLWIRMNGILAMASARGRTDVVRAVRRCHRNSRWLQRYWRLRERLSPWIDGRAVVEDWARAIDKRVLDWSLL